MKEKLKHIYEHHYKALLIIPFLLIFLALLQIGLQYYQTGDFVNRGITLKGGSTITITKTDSLNTLELEQFLQQQFTQADIQVRTLSSAGRVTAVTIDSDIQDQDTINLLVSLLQQKLSLSKTDYSVEIIGESLGSSFFKQTIIALGVAFVLMGIVVFIYFHTLIPSLAVILAAFSDIIVTLAIFNLTGIKLSTSGIAAFLMLIGYSVDTDILQTSRLLKRREGSVMDRVYSAMKTGMTMIMTTIVVVLIAYFLVQSDTVKQIMLILLIGLMVDMIMTWIQNTAILRWYLEKKSNS